MGLRDLRKGDWIRLSAESPVGEPEGKRIYEGIVTKSHAEWGMLGICEENGEQFWYFHWEEQDVLEIVYGPG